MNEADFEAYMLAKNLADKTRQQRIYALKRIERAHSIDMDTEFDRDQLASMSGRFAYSAADDRAGAPNPSKLDIDQDKLLTHLRWYRSHIVDYRRFRMGEYGDAESAIIEDPAPTEMADAVIEEAVGRTFALERDLQVALRANLSQLEDGLTVADGGSERRVEAGFIDILARDRTNKLTVIELKSETARPESIAQILAYMGCLAEEENEEVRGILVAGDHHIRVTHAARAIQNLDLKKYRFKFEFG